MHTWIFAANSYGRLASLKCGIKKIVAGERCVDPWKRWHEFAIKSHADYLTDFPRIHLVDKVLYACDELAGFITAVAYVRPEGIQGMKAKSVRKKMKSKGFAATVNRDDIIRGADDLGIDLNEHIQFVIEAMAENALLLKLGPSR